MAETTHDDTIVGDISDLVPVTDASLAHIENGEGFKRLASLSAEEFERRLVDTQLTLDRLQAIIDRVMKEGIDFGQLPGTKKPMLYQEGATLIGRIFRLVPTFEREEIFGDGVSAPHYVCKSTVLLHENTMDGPIVYTAGSIATSHESKYRWRLAKLRCPTCEAETIKRSQYKAEWYCYAKIGGCGAVFALDDRGVTDQPRGVIENPDIADQFQAVQQMADKRALTMATRRYTGAGRHFGQDEDVIVEQDDTKQSKPAEPAAQTSTQEKFEPPADELMFFTALVTGVKNGKRVFAATTREDCYKWRDALRPGAQTLAFWRRNLVKLATAWGIGDFPVPAPASLGISPLVTSTSKVEPNPPTRAQLGAIRALFDEKMGVGATPGLPVFTKDEITKTQDALSVNYTEQTYAATISQMQAELQARRQMAVNQQTPTNDDDLPF